jgi:serine phosphatase RsbU (regulator of sigma subunit)
MNPTFFRFVKFFWPDLANKSLSRQLVGAGDVFATFYSTILYLIGLGWLFIETDFNVIPQNWELLLLLTIITVLFTYLNFFVIIEFREDRYGSSDGAFNSMAVWVSVLLLGPTSLWIIILIQVFQFLFHWSQSHSISAKWNHLRAFSFTLAGFTIPYLIGLKVYEHYGGNYPIDSLDIKIIIAAFMGIISNYLTLILIWLPYFAYVLYTQKRIARELQLQPIAVFFILALTLPTLAHPFAILAAGLYTINGLAVFLYFISGLVIVAYLTQQFSRIAENNRQQTRQLEKLELLSRAILTAPPDSSSLPAILEEHIPNMFPPSDIFIWMIPGQTLFKSPADWEVDCGVIWDWVSDHTGAQIFLVNEKLPWQEIKTVHRPVICTPIMAHEGPEVIGGIYMELRQLAQPWDKTAMRRLFPALHSLADQISSAIHLAEEYARSIALQKVSHEIQIAGQIQASFLPNRFPNIPGWQLAVTLEPAGGLSGDFFDFIPLSRGRYGIVIADVADKGLGAALYMALSRTLIRTYALEYHTRPDLVFSESNERVLMDSRANLFITCFYGVLDPNESTLLYCNAGHNPPYLISPMNNNKITPLERTGMPIGIEEDSRWERKTIGFLPGDKLILYTDGITEAQNENGEFFEDNFLVETIQGNAIASAFDLQENILGKVREFTGNAPQYDDIALMILEKERETSSSKKKKPID